MKYISIAISLFITMAIFSSCLTSKDVTSSSSPISHATWDNLLKKHVSPAGWVNYKGFIEDRATFDSYLDLISKNHPNKENWSEDERFAYWINAYNAYTVQLVIDKYPVASIKDVKSGIPFVSSVWDIKFIKIEGQKYDLNNIEHLSLIHI